MIPNYRKICQDLIKNLPQRQRDIIEQRFGLKNGEKKTLEAIGQGYDITRERVRQIEEDGFSKIKQKLTEYQKVFQYFYNKLHKFGDLKKEENLLSFFGDQKFQNQVFFLLTLSDKFQRFSENKEFYSFWATNSDSVTLAKEVLDFLYEKFERIEKPLSFKEIFGKVNPQFDLTKEFLKSILEISREIQPGLDSLYGPRNWPEINPRGVKDRAYLIFKNEKKPLHFSEVTRLINNSEFEKISQPKVLLQTVHNELIKDSRFVLVGRGLYALREWGYQPGEVKEIISMILKEEKRSLTKEEIIEKVLKQRIVKVNTILINLNYFPKTSNGKYRYGEKPILG